MFCLEGREGLRRMSDITYQSACKTSCTVANQPVRNRSRLTHTFRFRGEYFALWQRKRRLHQLDEAAFLFIFGTYQKKQ